MDNGILIMIIGILVEVIFINIGVFLWARTQARSDRIEFVDEIRGWNQAIREEMRDFHNRLCEIEKKNKGE